MHQTLRYNATILWAPRSQGIPKAAGKKYILKDFLKDKRVKANSLQRETMFFG